MSSLSPLNAIFFLHSPEHKQKCPKTKHVRLLTQHTQLCLCSDVVVLVGGCTAVAARVIVSDTPDDQITARQQRVLLIPTVTEKVLQFCSFFICLFYQIIKHKIHFRLKG